LKVEGNNFFKEKKYEEATKSYTEALKIDPHLKTINSMLYANRAAALKAKKQLKEALTDCKKAVEIDP